MALAAALSDHTAGQAKLLAEVAQQVDAGRIRTTAHTHFGAINAANLRQAHTLIESGMAQGKVVLEDGW
jgi:NADPH:quinone reductase-like Zn-dependent oxidoreductase